MYLPSYSVSTKIRGDSYHPPPIFTKLLFLRKSATLIHFLRQPAQNQTLTACTSPCTPYFYPTFWYTIFSKTKSQSTPHLPASPFPKNTKKIFEGRIPIFGTLRKYTLPPLRNLLIFSVLRAYKSSRTDVTRQNTLFGLFRGSVFLRC